MPDAYPVEIQRLPNGVRVLVVAPDDPVLLRVRDLCYETLHRPFGVSRNDDWNEAEPDSTHIVAVDGERLAGYARLIVSGQSGQIRQVAVEPDYRNRGLASALVGAAVRRARALGLHRAFLHARERAVGMYERLGFHVVGEPFRMGRTYLAHVLMELPLR